MTSLSEPAGWADDPQVRRALITHARLGLRVQVVLRALLVLFAAATSAFVAPARFHEALYVAVGVYAVAAVVANTWLLRGGERAVRFGATTLFLDVAALAVMTLIAGQAATQSWTADLLINALFVVPLLAATQLRPGVCAAVVLPNLATYLVASLATEEANTEPRSSVLLRVVALAGLSAGCVALSAIQRSRVRTIGSLVAQRAGLLSDLLVLEAAEQRRLSEQLHDGALQYVLAARMDLEDLTEHANRAVLARVDDALRQTVTLLRTTVADLYPAVLEQAGFPAALRQTVASAAARGGFTASIDVEHWPTDARTSVDRLLFSAARELLANVVKHADASVVSVSACLSGSNALLLVSDDGAGIPSGELERKLRGGHIGMASHRARLDAAGGRLILSPVGTGGTRAEVTLPAARTDR